MSEWHWKDRTGADCRVRLLPDKVVWSWSRSTPSYVATEHEQTLEEYKRDGPSAVPPAWQPIPPHVITEMSTLLSAQARQSLGTAATQYGLAAMSDVATAAASSGAGPQASPAAGSPISASPTTSPSAGATPAAPVAATHAEHKTGAAFDEQIAHMYRSGQQLEAIRLYRERYRKSEMLAREEIEGLLYKYK